MSSKFREQQEQHRTAHGVGLARVHAHAKRMHQSGRISAAELKAVESHVLNEYFTHHQTTEQYAAMRKTGDTSALSSLRPREGQSVEDMQRERAAAVRKVQAGFLVDAYEAGAIDDKTYMHNARSIGIVPEHIAKMPDDKAANELWTHQLDPDAEPVEPPTPVPSWARNDDDKVDEEYVRQRRAEDAADYRERTGGLDAPDNTPAKRHPDRDPEKRVTRDPTDMSVGEYAKARRDDSVDLVVKSEPAGESATASEAA
jgi:hypothetical protein